MMLTSDDLTIIGIGLLYGLVSLIATGIVAYRLGYKLATTNWIKKTPMLEEALLHYFGEPEESLSSSASSADSGTPNKLEEDWF